MIAPAITWLPWFLGAALLVLFVCVVLLVWSVRVLAHISDRLCDETNRIGRLDQAGLNEANRRDVEKAIESMESRLARLRALAKQEFAG